MEAERKDFAVETVPDYYALTWTNSSMTPEGIRAKTDELAWRLSTDSIGFPGLTKNEAVRLLKEARAVIGDPAWKAIYDRQGVTPSDIARICERAYPANVTPQLAPAAPASSLTSLPPAAPASPNSYAPLGVSTSAPRSSVFSSTRKAVANASLYLAIVAIPVGLLVQIIASSNVLGALTGSEQEISAAVETYYTLTLLSVLLMVPAQLFGYVAIMVWLHRSVRIAKHVEPRFKWSPGWAVGAWFIPLISLVYPYQMVRDSLKCLTYNRDRGSNLVVWWAAWLSFGFLSQMDYAISRGIFSVQSTQEVQVLLALSIVVQVLEAAACLISGLQLIKIVTRMDYAARSRVRVLN